MRSAGGVAELLRIKVQPAVGCPAGRAAADEHFLRSASLGAPAKVAPGHGSATPQASPLQHDQCRAAEARILLQSVYYRFSEASNGRPDDREAHLDSMQ